MDACSTCCAGAGFSSSSFAGTSCSCFSGSNTDVCAAALKMSNPAQACSYCCINNGYLGVDYSTLIGGARCACKD
jgi:hypothetical protein